jgi:hypothetical protein
MRILQSTAKIDLLINHKASSQSDFVSPLTWTNKGKVPSGKGKEAPLNPSAPERSDTFRKTRRLVSSCALLRASSRKISADDFPSSLCRFQKGLPTDTEIEIGRRFDFFRSVLAGSGSAESRSPAGLRFEISR